MIKKKQDLVMSEARIGAWRKNFTPDERGFPVSLETHAQHVAYVEVNGVANYLAKVKYPKVKIGEKLLSRVDSLAIDYEYSKSHLDWLRRNHTNSFVMTVRGFLHYKRNRKVVNRDRAKVKGEELK